MEDPVGGPTRDPERGRESSRAFLDGLLDRLPDPALFVGAEATVLAANDALCALLDRPPATVPGCQLPSLFPDLTMDEVSSAAGGSGERVTTAVSGTDRRVEFGFERQTAEGETVYLGTARDATDALERQETLEQYDRIFETIEDGIFTLDESFTIGTVNSAVKSMTGYSEGELVGANATLLADESTIDEAVEMSRQLQEGDRDVGTLTTELTTADGETLPIETRFSPFRHDDDTMGQVGVVRDISDRRRFARALAALHDSTRQLLEAGTRSEVAEIIAETATETLDLSDSEFYLFDRAANVLRPVVGPGDPVGPGDGPVWDVFIDESAGDDGERYWSLCEHGVFVAALDERDERLRELVDLLVSSAEAALARVDRETALRDREAEYRRQNDQLRRLKGVNEIIRRVDRALVEADTTAAIEQAVCEELTESQWFSFAWIGRHDGTAVEPRTWAGRSSGYLDGLDLSTDVDNGPPAVRTARSGEPTVIDSISDGLRDEPWRSEAISRDFQSAISIPLEYDGFRYGVLTVYADEVDRFGEMLESVFVELGESIANAIREIQSRNRQPTDSVIELDLSVASEDTLIAQLARRLDVTVTCEGGVPGDDGTTRLFVRLPDADPSSVRARVETMSRIRSVSAVSDDGLFEIVATGPTLVRTLVDQGARVGELTSTPTGVDVTLQVASGTDVRTFVTQLENHYSGVRLHARRERATHSQYGDSMRSVLEERLTDRQIEVLRTAYLSGFFEWPRETTGEEVAEMLDITQPTVNRHLRVSERKLLDLLFST
jgi:PAS domain S-box-containing protein